MTEKERDRSLLVIRTIDVMRNLAARIDGATVCAMVAMYRGGKTQMEIAEALLPSEVGKSPRVAESVVGRLLRANMPDDELGAIRFDRRVQSGRALGNMLPKDPNTGMGNAGRAALQQRIDSGEIDGEIFVQAARRGGREAARINRRNSTGIFGLSLKTRREVGSVVGARLKEERRGIFDPKYTDPEVRRARMSRMLEVAGKTRLSDAERARLMNLADDPRFIRQNGKRPGTPDYPQIQTVLCSEFGIMRTIGALKSEVHRLRKNRARVI